MIFDDFFSGREKRRGGKGGLDFGKIGKSSSYFYVCLNDLFMIF